MHKLFEGLLNNALLTILSSIIPIIFGGLMIVLCKKDDFIRKVVQIVSLFFESICPLVTIMSLYYGFLVKTEISYLIVVVAFTISFMGYIPKRYNEIYSIKKNIVINSLGLVSAIFKWSFCASTIGVMEMLYSASTIVAYTFDTGVYWTVLAISFIIVFALELTRYLLKEYLD